MAECCEVADMAYLGATFNPWLLRGGRRRQVAGWIRHAGPLADSSRWWYLKPRPRLRICPIQEAYPSGSSLGRTRWGIWEPLPGASYRRLVPERPALA